MAVPAVLELRPSAITCTSAGWPAEQLPLEILVDLDHQQAPAGRRCSVFRSAAPAQVGHAVEHARAVEPGQQSREAALWSWSSTA